MAERFPKENGAGRSPWSSFFEQRLFALLEEDGEKPLSGNECARSVILLFANKGGTANNASFVL